MHPVPLLRTSGAHGDTSCESQVGATSACEIAGKRVEDGAGGAVLAQRMAYSVRETAELLGVSEKTIRRLIYRKLLRASRALRHILIPRTEIDRFLKLTLEVER